MEKHCKNVIIGFGKGGKTLASWLAARGEEVAIIEKSDKMYGGSCINVACIPTKSLIVILREKTGLLKAVVDNGSGKILGCMLYCAEAHEMINTVQLAMNAGLRYEVLRDQIYTHPSMTESFNELFSSEARKR